MFTDAHIMSYLTVAIVVLLVGMVAVCIIGAIGGAVCEMLEKRKPRNEFKGRMREARRMMGVARADIAEGCPHAARCAAQSALAYRKAAHAHAYYAVK